MATREPNYELITRTMQVINLSETTPHTFGDGHRNVGYQQGDQIASWQDDDGFYACLQGIGEGGNWYETEDFGPCATRDAVIQEARSFYEERENELEDWAAF